MSQPNNPFASIGTLLSTICKMHSRPCKLALILPKGYNRLRRWVSNSTSTVRFSQCHAELRGSAPYLSLAGIGATSPPRLKRRPPLQPPPPRRRAPSAPRYISRHAGPLRGFARSRTSDRNVDYIEHHHHGHFIKSTAPAHLNKRQALQQGSVSSKFHRGTHWRTHRGSTHRLATLPSPVRQTRCSELRRAADELRRLYDNTVRISHIDSLPRPTCREFQGEGRAERSNRERSCASESSTSCIRWDFDVEIGRLNDDLNAVADWARDNYLSLNAAKTKVMILGSKFFTDQLGAITTKKVQIHVTELPYSSEVKSLGVWLHPNLDWGNDINRVARRIHGTLFSLRQCCRALSPPIRKDLVESLVSRILTTHA
ncbi:unnamed protein product [Trichogramma brassicae]|uniref:Reverse transcriptase domain-containing protein n=1 Tax=Trichogramma brassicae TaxID=86971 RepID=A0A6H5IWG9_9HYME|nr:unnamed protein product [Trichogramma brassicae]